MNCHQMRSLRAVLSLFSSAAQFIVSCDQDALTSDRTVIRARVLITDKCARLRR